MVSTFNRWGVHNFLARWDGQAILTPDLFCGTGIQSPDLSPEIMNLLNNQLLHAFNRILVFEAKVELIGADRFIRRVVPDLKVGVV